MKFKAGDRARQIAALFPGENPLVTITKIEGTEIYHRHDDSKYHIKHASEHCFKPVAREEIIYE